MVVTAVAASPSPTPDPTAGWTPLSNSGGQFSLRYPPDWGSKNCDTANLAKNAALGPEFKGASNTCHWSEGPATIEVFSATRQGQSGGVYVGQITSTTSINVDGVEGTRQTATVTANNTMAPLKGATQIVYKFVTGGRTYAVYYTREPGEPDLAIDVDNLVQQTFRFTA
jgi:hypothetical protein